MAKYAIIDLDKLGARTLAMLAIIGELKKAEIILSPEETEAKFKDVFIWGITYGYNSGYEPQHPKFSILADECFEEFKKTL